MIYTVTLNPAVDRELTLPAIELDSVLRASEQRVDAGGKGLNVSRMVRQLGGESIALGFVGGHAGQFLADELKWQGTETAFTEVSEETRTNISMVTEDGRRHLKVNEAGPRIAAAEMEALVDQLLGMIRPGDWCVLSGSLPPNVPFSIYANLISELRELRAQVLLDASGEPFHLGCQAAPDIVTPNLTEAIELTGHTSPLAAAKSIRQLGPASVIVTLGRESALLVDHQGAVQVAAPVIKERNAIGAGDALVGGLVFALNRGQPLPEALRRGVACGAVAAGLAGTAFGNRDAVEQVLRQVVWDNPREAYGDL